MNALGLALIVALLGVAAFVAFITIVRNVYVASPSEVLIFSGRVHKGPKGTVGFRVVRGGRAIRWPLVETVDRMPLTNMPIELSVHNAFSRGGVPLNVQAVANVKIPSEEPLLHNALERFLGYSQKEIVAIAKDTLEGNLRGVIAELTPEEINQNKVLFQQKLIEEAHRDIQRMGLVLDNLQIQNISDDVGYLTSVGRVRGAEVRRTARIGEVKAHSQASVQKAQNWMRSEVAKIDADIQVLQKENERRIVEAQTQREAVIAEVRGQVQAQIAEARAQLAAWEARAEQVRRKLEADVVAPAAAQKQQSEAGAKAQAAGVLAQGQAAADALKNLAQAYKDSGGRAKDAILAQKLVPVFAELTSTMVDLKIDRLTVLSGSGQNGSGASFANKLIGVNEQVRAATDIDLIATVQKAVDGQETSVLPPPAPQARRKLNLGDNEPKRG